MRHATLLSSMTPFPHHVPASAPLSTARAMMTEHRIRHLPVLDEAGAILGIVSDRDLLLAEQWIDSDEEPRVEVACTLHPYVVDVHTPLALVVEHMASEHIGSALVTREGKLAGILTTVDVCRALVLVLGGDASTQPPPEVA